MDFFSNLVLQALLQLHALVGNLGVAIILFTLIFRLVTYFFTRKSLRSMEKMRSIQGELRAIQQKYKGDPLAMQREQTKLYQKHNINPLAGCLPQLLQIFMLFVFYQAILKLLKIENLTGVNFLWLNLTQIDQYHLIPILAVLTQLFLSLMVAPAVKAADKSCELQGLKGKKLQEAKKDQDDTLAMAASMQKQMIFMMPFLSGFIAWNLPSGIGLYWIISTLFSIAQQHHLSGWGGVKVHYTNLVAKFKW